MFPGFAWLAMIYGPITFHFDLLRPASKLGTDSIDRPPVYQGRKVGWPGRICVVNEKEESFIAVGVRPRHGFSLSASFLAASQFLQT